MSRTVQLNKPLTTHAGQTVALELKEPTARSFFEYNEPFKILMKDGRVDFDYDNKAMLGFLADMSGVDQIILKDLAAKDYLAARTVATDLILGVAGDENPIEP
jgi:hypothetical protein